MDTTFLTSLTPYRENLYTAFSRRRDALFDLCDTLLRTRHPEQADRWTWLVVAASTQLRLARSFVADQRLPWERPLSPERFTPTRVRRGFSHLLCVLESPAKAPKPCGRSPGRPKGKRSDRAVRTPAITKALMTHRNAS